MQTVYEAIIIGGGPAGLSAALTLGRSCRKVLVCDDGRPRNAVADRMHGYLTRDGTPPGEMLALARAELQAYPSVELHAAHVEHARKEAGVFELTTDQGVTLRSKTVLLATGVYDALPDIEGLRDLWGRGVFVCPYCDGWEYRGKRIAVLGKGKRAVELAQELHQWTESLLVCSEGVDDLTQANRTWLRRTGADLRQAPLRRVGDDAGNLVLRFEDGTPEKAAALFLCAPLRQRYPLVAMLGCTLDDEGNIAADARGRTHASGVYAAGDAVSGVHQVILAAANGVCAGMAINEDLLAQEVAALSAP